MTPVTDLLQKMVEVLKGGPGFGGAREGAGRKPGSGSGVSGAKVIGDSEFSQKYGSRGVDRTPDGDYASWSPDKGGMLLHGSGASIENMKEGELFLTDDFSEAAPYAEGQHLGGTKGKPAVYSMEAKPGKTLDISEAVAEDIESSGDIQLDSHLSAARKSGARYVTYNHPSNYSETQEQLVVVSLYPKEDLSIGTKYPISKGAPGSGNFGHIGKPGGGSTPIVQSSVPELPESPRQTLAVLQEYQRKHSGMGFKVRGKAFLVGQKVRMVISGKEGMVIGPVKGGKLGMLHGVNYHSVNPGEVVKA